MEKKTIGSFIATLRKANGFTQKQLAQQLNVSDKAVSRWERDESMPDLSLIPELADIFGVTADEIIRGERKNPEVCEQPFSEKTAKQRKRLLTGKKTKYRIRTAFSIGIALLGLIVAMICNFGFLRAYIGFMAGAAFYVGAVICQVCFMIQNLSGLDEELLTMDETVDHREHTIRLGKGCFTAVVMLFAGSLPLLIFPYDTYQGITAGTWFGCGLLFAGIGYLICLAAASAAESVLTKRELINLGPSQKARHRLKIRYLKIGALVLAALFFIQLCLISYLPDLLRQGISFPDWDSFKVYMEMPTEAYVYVEHEYDTIIGMESVTVQAESEPIEEIYYDEYGNEIDEPMNEVLDAYGNVLCQYYPRNHNVGSWSYSLEDPNDPQIMVYTTAENRRVDHLIDDILMPAYCLLYPAVILAFWLLFKKKAKSL